MSDQLLTVSNTLFIHLVDIKIALLLEKIAYFEAKPGSRLQTYTLLNNQKKSLADEKFAMLFDLCSV